MDLLKDFEAVNEKEKLTEKYPLYAQDGKHGNTTVILKYFFPAGGGYVVRNRSKPRRRLYYLLRLSYGLSGR